MFKKLALCGVMILGLLSSFNMPNAHAETTVTYAIDPKYILAEPFSEGLAAVYGTGGWGFVDKNGKEIIKLSYTGAKSFSEGLAPVNVAEWGFIDKQGKVIVKPQYYDALPFSEGLAAVNGTGGWGFIDKNGKKVVKPKYYSVKAFSDGLAAVELSNRKWGFVDKTGKMVIDAQFFNVTETNNLNDTGAFREGLSAVLVGNKDNKRWGYILNPLNKP